jgi:hypothetical protein
VAGHQGLEIVRADPRQTPHGLLQVGTTHEVLGEGVVQGRYIDAPRLGRLDDLADSLNRARIAAQDLPQ